MNRLIDFFLKEQEIRWKVYLISSGVAFFYAVVNLFAFHRSEGRVSLEAVILLFVLVTIFATIYVAKGEAFVKESERPRRVVRFDRRLAVVGAVAAALVVFISMIDIPRLQAAIIDLRLGLLTAHLASVRAASLSDQQLQTRFRKIKSIVDTSSTNQIPVDPNLLLKTQAALSSYLKKGPLSDQTRQVGWTTAIDLESLAYTRMVQTGAITRVTPRQITKTAYVLNSPIFIENRTIFIQGEHSLIALGPGGGEFVLNQSNVVFDKIDFVGSISLPAIEIVGDRSNALVRDSIMKNVTQPLDRITWVDVRFENSSILYRGGPLRLRNVSFKDCDLSHLGFGPVHFELKKRITEALGQPITFIYEP